MKTLSLTFLFLLTLTHFLIGKYSPEDGVEAYTDAWNMMAQSTATKAPEKEYW